MIKMSWEGLRGQGPQEAIDAFFGQLEAQGRRRLTLEGESAAAPSTDEASEEPTDRSLPEFEVVGVEAVERAAAPTLRFEVRATDRSGCPCT